MIKISEICNQFELCYEGSDVNIDRLGLCNRETVYSSVLSYVTNEKYVENIARNNAISCVLLPEEYRKYYSEKEIGRKITYIFSKNPEIIFYKIHEELCKNGKMYEKYDFETKIGCDCIISEYAVIEKGVIIGDRVKIGHNTVIKAGTIIESDTTIGCNTTIGSEGFQLITNGKYTPMHITHVGRCHIASNVHIGDNTCVCNSLFEGETYISEGVKIDNLGYIAHNVFIGKNSVITAHVVLCGSTRIEEGVWVAPNASIINKVIVGKYSKVGMGSVVTKDVAPYSVVYGNPAREHKSNNK